MYGLVNKAIEDMVCDQFGEDTWETIKTKAGLEDLDYFISMEGYPDDVTHRLVRAACEVLGLSGDQVLQAFGEYWVTYTATEGYGELMDSAGDNLPEFLHNLDNLHARVGLSFPQLKPPEFACEDETETSMELHYRSQREGLGPMVVGLVKGLGKRFDVDVDVAHHDQADTGQDHDTFSITYQSPEVEAEADD